jgi:hypothetical protein
MKNKSFLILWVYLLGFVFGSGCRYQPGYPLEGKGKTLSLRVENRSLATQLGPILNRTVKEELLRSGVHDVVRATEPAYFQVRIIIDDYRKTAQAYNVSDALLASGFELNLQATVEVFRKRRQAGAQVFTLSSRGHVVRTSSLDQPKDRQALADIARDLGSRIAHRLSSQSFNP